MWHTNLNYMPRRKHINLLYMYVCGFSLLCVTMHLIHLSANFWINCNFAYLAKMMLSYRVFNLSAGVCLLITANTTFICRNKCVRMNVRLRITIQSFVTNCNETEFYMSHKTLTQY